MSKDSNLSLVEASPSGEVDTKCCHQCKVAKPLSDYYKRSRAKDGYAASCKVCQRKDWTKDDARNYNYIKKYGITLEDYNRMFKEQGGSCWICNTHQMELDKRLCVDHDHAKEGKESVRGLLCTECNRGLGTFVDDVERLKQAIKYLEKHN